MADWNMGKSELCMTRSRWKEPERVGHQGRDKRQKSQMSTPFAIAMGVRSGPRTVAESGSRPKRLPSEIGPRRAHRPPSPAGVSEKPPNAPRSTWSLGREGRQRLARCRRTRKSSAVRPISHATPAGPNPLIYPSRSASQSPDSRCPSHCSPHSPRNTMSADPISQDHLPPEPTCYFSLVLPASHFSTETPSTSPFTEYSPYIQPEPTNPLLAHRYSPVLPMSNPNDASRLLQLQTAAAHAHRPAAAPLQPRASSTSSSESDSSSSSTMFSSQSIFCCRCRRDCLAGMYQIGTNRYYCSHCAKMTGYSAG